jgi:hypothetical protein
MKDPTETTPFATFGEVVESINAKPAIELPRPGRLLSDFADELGRLLADTGEIYSRRGLPFAVDADAQGLEPVSPLWLQTWIERHVTPFVAKADGGGKEIRIANTLRENVAKSVIASCQFAAHLPPVSRFNPCPMPTMRDNGDIELLPIGYDRRSATVTADPGFTIAEPSLENSKNILDSLIAEFPFADDGGRSQSVAIAAMLSVFGAGLLQHGSLRPVFVYLANSEGAGKTLLASLAGLPYREASAEIAPKDEGEFAKKLLSVVISGRRFLILDNVRGHLASASLEAYATATSFGGRILGVSKEFHGEAGASILITGNSLTVSPDLRRRSLFCELFMHELRAEDRKFRHTLDAAEIAKHRPVALAALWGLVRHWDRTGRPVATHKNASFPRWSEVIGGIVEAAGYACPTAPAQIEGMGDTDTADFAELAATMDAGRRYTFGDLADLCDERGLFERVLSDREHDGLSRGAKRVFSAILARYDRRRVTAGSLFLVEGKGHSRRYVRRADISKAA